MTTASSAAAYRSDFLSSLALLRELGAFASPAPTAKKAKKAKRPSRFQRWADACAAAISSLEDLKAIQEEFEEWKDNMSENLQSTPVYEKLEAVCELDIDGTIDTVQEAADADLPLGFGRN